MEDMSRMTLGMWVDYCIQYNNDQMEASDEHEVVRVRNATQEDIDRFAKS